MTMSTPWVAGANSFQSQPATFERTMLLYCLNSIFRATGHISAWRREHGWNELTIKPNGSNRDISYNPTHFLPSNVVKLRLFYPKPYRSRGAFLLGTQKANEGFRSGWIPLSRNDERWAERPPWQTFSPCFGLPPFSIVSWVLIRLCELAPHWMAPRPRALQKGMHGLFSWSGIILQNRF